MVYCRKRNYKVANIFCRATLLLAGGAIEEKTKYMDKKSLQAYAKLQAQIKELEGKRDSTKIAILEAFEKEGIEKQETTFGTFTRAHKTTYSYSDKIDIMVEKVKLAKIREEEKGIAKVSKSEYLVFTKNK